MEMSTKESVINIVQELCGTANVKQEDSLVEDLALDSLNMVALLLYLEDELGIMLKEKDMNPYDLTTVGDVCALAERYCGE